VLVIGAGGGVGIFLVQLARLAGARVTAVCSAGKADLVRSLGAAEVVDYRADDLTRFAGRFAAVFDIAGSRPIGVLRRLARRGGTVALVGAEGGGRMFGELGRNLRAAVLSPFVPQRLVTVAAPSAGEDVAELRRLVESEGVRSSVGSSYPLADAARAIDDLAAGRISGKAVLIP
jgi:NADPH:quinone reductase-like Zn-dependent oxidoreductase